MRRKDELVRGCGKILWVSVTPVYLPAPGGGATQAHTIARGVAEAGDDMVILTEAYPGEAAHETIAAPSEGRGKAWVERRFPFRAGRERKDLRSYADYLRTNLQYLALPRHIDRIARDGDYAAVAILVHTSLLYSANLLEWILPQFHSVIGRPVVLIAELQDHFLPDSKLPLLSRFDRVVTTAEGVFEGITQRAPGIADKVHHVPMPFEHPVKPTDREVAATLAKFGLVGVRFLLNANGLTEWKHSAELREALRILRARPGLEDLVLVTVGRERDRTPADDEAERNGHAIYLGSVLRQDVFALMRAAEMTVVLSAREAISRVAVEAISIGAPVLLPDLAEYRAACPDYVCGEISPQGIADTVVRLLDAPPPRYPLEGHAADVFVPLYRAMIAETLERRG